MINNTLAQTLSAQQFKRRFGVQRETFKQIVKALQPRWRAEPKPGAKPKLGLEARVLLTLEYWREYRTYFHIGSSWGIHESTVCRIIQWVETTLMASGRFRLPGKKSLVKGFGRPSVVGALARERIVIEHVNRRLKIFKILAERYRNRCRRFGLRCNLIAALYNFEQSQAA